MEDIDQSDCFHYETWCFSSRMCRPFAASMKYYPIFIASTVVGVFPFSLVHGNLKLDRWLFSYSVAVISIISLLGLSVRPGKVEPFPIDPLAVTLNQIIVFLHVLQYPCCLCFILLKRNLLQQTVISIQHLIFTFKNLKNRTSKRFSLLNVLQPVLVVSIFCITGNILLEELALLSFIGLTTLGSVLCLSQFCFLLGVACDLLEAEIEVLRTIKRTACTKFVVKMVVDLIQKKNRITSVAENINSIYSSQLLYLMSARYLVFIMHSYFLIDHISKSFVTFYHFIIGDFCMLSYHLYYNWKITHASEIASKKSKEFNTLLYQLMIDDTTNEILHNDKLRLHISMKREVVFTACGFFNLDYTLVHSMIASATTYLVILIQFGQSGSAAPESLPTVITNLTTTPLPLSLTTYQ
ncbi:Gustatory receptor 43c [Halyomorpha halys]|nr:Gustatory receptor 43c [Halyomorpha halys]